MPSTPASLLGYAFFIVGAIATMGASLGTTHWIEMSSNGINVYFGLFKVCGQDKCIKYGDIIDQYNFTDLKVVQGLCIAAVVFYALTLLIIGHLVFGQKMLVQSRNHGSACMAIAVLGAILAWAGVGHFTAEVGNDDQISVNNEWNYGYSLYLASVSGGACIMAGIFAVIGVGYLFNTQRPQNVVFQAGVHPYPGVQVVSPAVNYGYPQNPQNPYPHPSMGAMGTQPTVMVNPHQAYMTTQKPPAY